MLTLGIETSCDETACAIVKNGKILSNIVSSSINLHKPYGGVVPEIASRYHLEYINSVFKKAIEKAGISYKNIELLAVTIGPGLCGSLLAGISFGKSLSYALSRPIIGINHVLAHLWSNFIERGSSEPVYPFIGLVISGGHTNIMLCRSLDDFSILGNTLDDAVGEAFDKTAKILKLGYPGGPVIERKARAWRGEIIKFPKVSINKNSLDFSFSGIKTAVLYYIKNKKLSNSLIAKISYSFQEAVFDVLVEKTVRAAQKHNLDRIVVGGGVAANRSFFQKIKKAAASRKIRLFMPKINLCVDNAAMVAALGERLYKEGHSSGLDLTQVTCLEDLVTL